jgi:dTDP-4-amino-4,6-dideoxygalactose transaminase
MNNIIIGYTAGVYDIWKPMHTQPMYRLNPFVTVSDSGRVRTNAYIAGGMEDVGADIFNRGLCLPFGNKMTVEETEKIIAMIRACFA